MMILIKIITKKVTQAWKWNLSNIFHCLFSCETSFHGQQSIEGTVLTILMTNFALPSIYFQEKRNCPVPLHGSPENISIKTEYAELSHWAQGTRVCKVLQVSFPSAIFSRSLFHQQGTEAGEFYQTEGLALIRVSLVGMAELKKHLIETELRIHIGGSPIRPPHTGSPANAI